VEKAKKRKALTIKDIARETGVSPYTVSAVINDYPSVKPETRAKVLACIKRLQYVPNRNARGLALGENSPSAHRGVFGVVLPADIRGGFSNIAVSDILNGIARESMHRGFSLMTQLIRPEYRHTVDTPRFITEDLVEGVIVISGGCEDLLRDLHARRIPYVVAEGSSFGVDSHLVYVDNVHAAYTAVEHLLSLGHREIGIISGGEIDSHPTAERLEGVRKALMAYHVPFRKELVEPGWFSFRGGYEATVRLLNRVGRVSALFCMNDISAIGALTALAERGLSVPGDISVVGFDDIEIAADTRPPLTTVHVPREQVGVLAVQQLDSIRTNTHSPYTRTILHAELIIRASTARVTGANDLHPGGGEQ